MYKVIGSDRKEYGPVDAALLRQWIAEGRVDAQTRVQAEGSSQWKFVADVPELLFALPTAERGDRSKTNSMALAGFITSLLSLLVCCFPLGALAIVLASMGLSQIKRDPTQGGRALALAAIIISIISLLIMAVLMFGFFMGVGNGDAEFPDAVSYTP